MQTTIVKLPLQEVEAMMISWMRQTGKSLLEAELMAKGEVSETIELASHNIKVKYENGELI
jgi:hypothetical protein